MIRKLDILRESRLWQWRDTPWQLTEEEKNQENSADFIQCVAFGKAGEFADRYLHKGTKIVLTGRIQTGSYTNKEGQRVYTTDVVAEDQEFAESKNTEGGGTYSNQPAPAPQQNDGGFMSVDEDSELPFT